MTDAATPHTFDYTVVRELVARKLGHAVFEAAQLEAALLAERAEHQQREDALRAELEQLRAAAAATP